MNFFTLYGFLISILFTGVATGEVERVAIRWNTVLCNGTCIGRLANSVRSIREISDLRIDEPAGMAEMKWNSSAPFSFEPFRLASGAAGIRFNDIRLRVKGKIDYNGRDFYLISDHDLTSFRLIGPVKTEPGRYTVSNNMESRPVPPDMQELFLHTKATGGTLVISGPLFLPRTYPNVLIAEQIKLPKKDSMRNSEKERRREP